jgi:hypothetical protein
MAERRKFFIEMNKLKLVILVFCVFNLCAIYAQEDFRNTFNPILVGVPSLTIAPDARGGGMGDIGGATDPDLYSQYWNPAKYAFAYSKAGVGLSYTPWLRNLVDDIYLAYLAGYYKLGDDDRQAIGASLRYFSLGEIMLHSAGGEPIGVTSPYEMSVDLSYSRKLSENFSLAGAFRYIRSDLGTGANANEGIVPGNAFAADLAGYYSNYIMAGNSECLFGLGFNISNVGTKISYDQGSNSNFIPTNLRLGTSFLFPLDDYNTLSLNLDVNKYLVPTRPNTEGMSEAEKQAAMDAYNDIGPIEGIFRSFTDAPGGMKEKFQEIMWSFGAEYAYNRQFFVRGGYFYENPNKGNRQYFSIGTGFKLSAFQLDAAYLISTLPNNPLDQTLRFSLSFDMDGLKNIMK